jgi:hypothetical protein
MTVFAACEQIALPMTGNSAVFNLHRSFANRDGIDDLPAELSRSARVPGATYKPLGPEVLNQLLFQHSPGLNE